MVTLSPDTHLDSEQVQLTLIRKADPARRMVLVRSLSKTVINLSRRAIRRANPDADEQELSLIFLALHYGENVAKEVRQYLDRREM
jgi:hypothetical protein